MQGSGIICFLSGLEIPVGKVSREHYYPRSLLPSDIAELKENKYYACKIINQVKGNLRPCEFEKQKFELTLYAIKRYHIKNSDRKFLRAALKSWETYKINPCDYCIGSKLREYCCKGK